MLVHSHFPIPQGKKVVNIQQGAFPIDSMWQNSIQEHRCNPKAVESRLLRLGYEDQIEILRLINSLSVN